MKDLIYLILIFTVFALIFQATLGQILPETTSRDLYIEEESNFLIGF
jgi:hypothetical protein